MKNKTRKNNTIPKSYGEVPLSPVLLNREEEYLCNKLDDLYESYRINKTKKPSECYKGAIHASREENQSNPDWLSQAVNSLREIVYPFIGDDIDNKKQSNQKQIKDFVKAGNLITADKFGSLNGRLNSISHHNKIEDFDKLRQEFIEIMNRIYKDQLAIHERIDKILLKDDWKLNKNRKLPEHLEILISYNFDAKQYLFAKASKKHFNWLWENKFLDNLVKQPDDSSNKYGMPELEYFERMSEEDPVKVTEIIKTMKFSEENINYQVMDLLFSILGKLPVEEIAKLTGKIRDEEWIYIMRRSSESGYKFISTIDKLMKNNQSKTILEFAQAIIFPFKKNEELIREKELLKSDNPFYVHDLKSSGIFTALSNIDTTHTEKALKLCVDTLKKILKLETKDKTGIFELSDSFRLYDIDLFTLTVDSHHLMHEDIKELYATIKKLIENTIGNKANDINKVKELFKYIEKLPLNSSTWRLKLFTIAQRPEAFKKDLYKIFSKLFTTNRYYEIESGTEYKKALRICFPYFFNNQKRDYIEKVFDYFSNKARNDNSNKNYHLETAWEIISSLPKDEVTNVERKKCIDIFGKKCDENYEPISSISGVITGFISSKAPIDLSKFRIKEIITKIKDDWSPEKLDETYKSEDFFVKKGFSGFCVGLREDIKTRSDDYIVSINDFFDRENINPKYLYSLLSGIYDMFRDKKTFTEIQIYQLFQLFEKISMEGNKKSFELEENMEGWMNIHHLIADILPYILSNEIKEKTHKSHREKIKEIIAYLFTIKSSPSKAQEKPDYGEPYGVAINSIRGKAYKSFTLLVQNDDKCLSPDVKELYKKILLDYSIPIRFLIGRELAFFYFRDKEFISDLFSEIFPKDSPEKNDIYLATWEGYLSNSLYEELFITLSDFYNRAITLQPIQYTDRVYFRDLDKSLAVHLALAFAHFDLKINDPLFNKFWESENVTRQKEFISFIGRNCLSRENAGKMCFKANNVNEKKLIGFWDWALSNIKQPEILSGFGYWINPDQEVLKDSKIIDRISKTLQISGGNIDWDYGLLKRLPTLAKTYDSKTLEIILNYFLNTNKDDLNNYREFHFLYLDEIKEALKIIVKKDDLKKKVKELINILIEKRSRTFWDFEEILGDKNS